MKLFSVGPVQMYPETLATAAKQLPYFRDPSFSSIMLEMQQDLHKLLNLKKGKSVFLTGSGTCAMESLVACSLRQNNKVLIINGGTFGDRFTRLCQMYHIPYDELLLPYPKPFQKELLYAIDGSCYDAILVNLHETSTGQLYPIEVISAYAKQYGLYLIVDAISTFLADPYDMDTYGIDATILSSQKALACSPGISMISMQESFYEEMITPKEDICMYLSIKEHVKNMERGQTPNTPAVGILLELAQMFKLICKKGLHQKILDTQAFAMYFRSLLNDLPVVIPDYQLSNALTPIYFPEGNANAIYEYLKTHEDIYVTPNGGALRNNMLRVGHLGNVTLSDYDVIYRGMKEILT